MNNQGQLYLKKEYNHSIMQGLLAIGISQFHGEFPIYTNYKSVSTEDPQEVHDELVSVSPVDKFDEILIVRSSSVIHHYMDGRDFNIVNDQNIFEE